MQGRTRRLRVRIQPPGASGMTRDEAQDKILADYGDWSYDDPAWWEDMIEMLMEGEDP